MFRRNSSQVKTTSVQTLVVVIQVIVQQSVGTVHRTHNRKILTLIPVNLPRQLGISISLVRILTTTIMGSHHIQKTIIGFGTVALLIDQRGEMKLKAGGYQWGHPVYV